MGWCLQGWERVGGQWEQSGCRPWTSSTQWHGPAPGLVQPPCRVARVLWWGLRQGRCWVSSVGQHLTSLWVSEDQEALVWWWLPVCWLAPV